MATSITRTTLTFQAILSAFNPRKKGGHDPRCCHSPMGAFILINVYNHIYIKKEEFRDFSPTLSPCTTPLYTHRVYAWVLGTNNWQEGEIWAFKMSGLYFCCLLAAVVYDKGQKRRNPFLSATQVENGRTWQLHAHKHVI